MENKIHSVKYNFIMNFILTASSFLFPLITFPYVSRVLLAEGNGKVAFAISVANYFMMVASLGIPTYGVRACAKVRDNKDELSKTAQEILLINLVATILVTATYIVCIFIVPKFAQDPKLFLICGVNIVLNMFGANWIYQALEQYDYITARSIFFKAISVVLMFALVHQQTDYRIYAAITVLSSVGSNVMNFVRLRKIITFHRFEHYEIKKHLKPIFILFAQSVTVSIYTNLDTVMLGFMKTDRDVGLYNAAVKIKNVLLSVVSSLGSVLLPRMSYYVKQGSKDKFIGLMAKALNAVLFMGMPLVTYFVFESRDAILFLAGKDYLGAIAAMQIITFAIVPNGLTGVLGVQVLTPLDKEKYVLYSVVVGAVSDFILNLIMIPIWGAAGAALATTIAEFLVLIAQLVFAKQYVKEVRSDIHVFKYLIFALIALVPTVLVSRVNIGSSFVRLVITALVYFIVYGLALIINKDEMMYRALDNKVTGRFIRRS
jgi:O-antigen/teichoic acid export membrane protein